MRHAQWKGLLLVMMVSTLACGRNHESKMEMDQKPVPEEFSKAQADSTNPNPVSSSAAVEDGKDTSRKFIRTAELKFKVRDVIKATYAVEGITQRLGGFVTYTNLTSNTDNTSNISVSPDSSVESTYFTVANEMTLRVPNTRLDTTLKEMSALIDYLDYRVIKADDVMLTMLGNRMTQDRVALNERRLVNAIDHRSRKLGETASAEELLLDGQEEADNARLENLSLHDQVAFSTIKLSLYQRQSIRREMVPTDKPIEVYAPALGSRLLVAMKGGWKLLEDLVVIIAGLWAVVLLGVVVFLIYRRFAKRNGLGKVGRVSA